MFGESVGTAYVRLIADGSGVPDDIKKAMDDLEPVLRDAGADHAAAYDKAFDKQYEKDNEKFRAKAEKNLEKGLGKMNAIGRVIGEDTGDNFFEGLREQLSKRFDSQILSNEIVDSLQADFARDGSYQRILARLENIGAESIAAQKRLDALANSIATNRERAVRQAEQQADREAEAMRRFESEFRSLLNETDAMAVKSASLIEDLWIREGDAIDRVRASANAHDRQQRTLIRSLDEHVKKADEANNKYKQFNKTLDDYADKTGRAFGKGARNDFVNLIGSMVGGITKLAFLAPKAGSSLIAMFKGEGGQLDLAQLVSKGAAGVTGLVIAISALVLVAGPVAALISGITAAVIALAGSLVFAAGAVGGVALALTGPLVAGIGVAVLALTNLDKKTKDSLSGLGDEFKELGKSAGEAIGPGVRRAAEGLRPVIAGLEPLVDGIAEALGRVAVGWSKSLQGQGFKDFRATLEDFLPNAIERLGQATGNLAGGFGGIFTAAIPQARRFIDWLEDITNEFSEWANSPRGQKELKQFFADAADSAIAVKNAVRDVSEAILDLFNKSKGDGDSLFQSLADQAQELVDYLADPKNADAISGFFENGKDTAENIGQLLLDITELIDDFDTEESRKELDKLFGALGDVLGLLGELVDLWEALWNNRVIELDVVFSDDSSLWEKWKAINPFARLSGFIAGQFKDAFDAIPWTDLPDMARVAVRRIGNSFEALPNRVRNAIEDLPSKVGNVLNRLQSVASRARDRAAAPFNSLGSRVQRAINDLPEKVGNVMGRAVRQAALFVVKIAAEFNALPGKIINNIDSLPADIAVLFGGVVAVAAKFPAMIAGKFAGLAGMILDQIGTIDIGSLIKVPARLGAGFLSGLRGDAAGDIVVSPRLGWTGEDGPEAIVPLNRPLSRVNPNVRELSAIAQGLAAPGASSPGRSVDVHEGAIQIIGVLDPRAAATMALNDLVAKVG